MLAVKSGFILFIKNYQFPIQINTLERERERERQTDRERDRERDREKQQEKGACFALNQEMEVYGGGERERMQL